MKGEEEEGGGKVLDVNQSKWRDVNAIQLLLNKLWGVLIRHAMIPPTRPVLIQLIKLSG